MKTVVKLAAAAFAALFTIGFVSGVRGSRAQKEQETEDMAKQDSAR